jgi:hypothetical protein
MTMLENDHKSLHEKMDQPQAIRCYSYPGRERLKLIALPLALLIAGLPACIVGLIAYLYLLLVGRRAVGAEVATLFGSILFLLTFVPMVVNTHIDIQLREEGLLVRIFAFRFIWKLVPWEEIIRVTPSPRPDRWWRRVWVVQVKRLTLWHRLLSATYFTGWQPGIVITSDLQDREELLKIIRDRSSVP